jgi:alanyl-tRNA synthetase
LNTDEIRSSYLKFFEEKGSSVIPSSSLVPYGDPTLLFTSAGMVQFKSYYLGQQKPNNPRLASCQKCFRTTDIESVGDTKHLTFFEMLGNFSIGDYFKKEAISWAWEYVVDRLKIDAERLWITVFTDDDESFRIWHDKVGVPENRIMRFGEKDNFWGPAGSSGPCGPCSELHYDFGKGEGCGKPSCDPSCGCGRFVEIWNLVFTQYNQDENKVRKPLPRPNIDTGMGLERMSAVVNGKTTVYETDVFLPLLESISLISGRKYGVDDNSDNSMRVIAEHSRAIAFLLADGVMPSNDGRGYVLRRLIRRAALFGKRLGLEKPFLQQTTTAAIERMKDVYPELAQRQELVLRVSELEETRFHENLNTGLALLDNLIADPASQVRNKIPGTEVFKLYDTYGFPIELTREIVTKAGLTVDVDGFEKEMEKQKERARSSHKFELARNAGKVETRSSVTRTEFVGYRELKSRSIISDILVNGRSTDAVEEGQEAAVILAATPFYAEMGGQVGDTGVIKAQQGEFVVANTTRIIGDITVHQGKLAAGSLAVGAEVAAEIDRERRLDVARNHTSTHLLQYALRQVLGEHVQQRGSMVAPYEFRFDFSHMAALTRDEIQAVQHMINEKIRDNLAVSSQEMPYKEAVASGATALFDEKYGDLVRVVKIGDPSISAELCGGTHIGSTGQIGFFQIVSESSIGSGLRRVTAVTGRGAETLLEHDMQSLQKVAESLGTAPSGVHDKVVALLNELEGERKGRLSKEKDLSRKTAGSLLDAVEDVNGIKVLAVKVPSARIESLREMTDVIKGQLGSGVIVLGTVFEDKPSFVAAVTPDLVSKGYSAGDIVKKVAQVTGGGGGGKPGLAQAGGKDASKVDEALKLVRTLIK